MKNPYKENGKEKNLEVIIKYFLPGYPISVAYQWSKNHQDPRSRKLKWKAYYYTLAIYSEAMKYPFFASLYVLGDTMIKHFP